MTASDAIGEVDGPLSLQYDDGPSVDSNSQYPDERVFVALWDYLQPGGDAITSLNSSIDKIVQAFLDTIGSGYGYRDLVQVVFDLAEQVPFQHIAYSKLVGAVWALRNDENLGKKSGFKSDIQFPTANFDQAFTERLSDLFGGFEDAESYVNFNAFHARIQNSHLMVPGCWAAASMRAALASRRSTAQMAEREAYFSGAAQSILWDGQATFKVCGDRSPIKGYPTFQEWSSWKQGFEDFSHGEKVGDECKWICKIVVQKMKELEEGKN